MSFSSDIKEKLCGIDFVCPRCRIYETGGALDFGAAISDTSIKFTTENESVAKRIRKDLLEAFGIETQIQKGARTSRIEIDDANSVQNVKDGISVQDGMPFSCCRAAYARGAFLGGGSVTAPQKGYHLEFNTKLKQNAHRLQEMLLADGIQTKITQRKGYHVVYIKGGENIADLLGCIGAASGVFEMYSVQIEREMRNSVNRRVNCETANTNKTALASGKHLVAIKKIKQSGKWDKLPDVLKEIGSLREEYPEDSLKELGERIDPPIGKSGVNHRLSRILEFAQNL